MPANLFNFLMATIYPVLEAGGPFGKIKNLLNALFKDITSTFITLFMVGILVCALGAAFGGDEHHPKFKRGLILCIAGVIVFALAKPIVNYLQSHL